MMSSAPVSDAPESVPRGRRVRAARWCNRSGALPLIERLRQWHAAELRIVAYHRVLSLPEPDDFDFDLEVVSAGQDHFERQVRLLQQRYHPLRLVDAVDLLDKGKPLPKGAVVITFDDGYDDNYHVAFPILKKLGIPATFFVCTGHIDNGLPYAYDWFVHMLLMTDAARLELPHLGVDQTIPRRRAERRELAGELLFQMKSLDAIQYPMIDALGAQWGMPREQPHADCRPMTWDQLREMHAAGMEIGSHGMHHRMLSRLPVAEMRAEIEGSKTTLDRELHASAITLSYPVGREDAYNADVVHACEATGFRMGCTYLPGINRWPAPAMFDLRRLAVERNMDEAWFAAMLTAPGVFSYPPRSASLS